MYLTKIAPEANQFRFYRMDIVPGLFGHWGLVREWGRIGSAGQVPNPGASARLFRFDPPT